jgi:hypothetical protein
MKEYKLHDNDLIASFRPNPNSKLINTQPLNPPQPLPNRIPSISSQGNSAQLNTSNQSTHLLQQYHHVVVDPRQNYHNQHQ